MLRSVKGSLRQSLWKRGRMEVFQPTLLPSLSHSLSATLPIMRSPEISVPVAAMLGLLISHLDQSERFHKGFDTLPLHQHE